jgi:hypothetical protein
MSRSGSVKIVRSAAWLLIDLGRRDSQLFKKKKPACSKLLYSAAQTLLKVPRFCGANLFSSKAMSKENRMCPDKRLCNHSSEHEEEISAPFFHWLESDSIVLGGHAFADEKGTR